MNIHGAAAGEVTALLGFVSLNMRGIRKILKKLAKHVPPSSPMPGYVALEIDHPHEPEKRILSVRSRSVSAHSPEILAICPIVSTALFYIASNVNHQVEECKMHKVHIRATCMPSGCPVHGMLLSSRMYCYQTSFLYRNPVK